MIKLQVLSSITSEKQVFDNLVKVKRLDTNEVGLLLCSHCCKFPEKLVDKADWIEGCFTTKKWEKDHRLLLGAHPSEATNWKVIQENGFVFLELSLNDGFVGELVGELEGEVETLTIDFPHPLYKYESDVLPVHVGRSNYRFLRTLWNSLSEGREGTETILAFFSTLAAMLEQGRITFYQGQAVWSLLAQWGFIHAGLRVTWSTRPENYNVEEYYDAVYVVRNNIYEGYLKALKVIKDDNIEDLLTEMNYSQFVYDDWDFSDFSDDWDSIEAEDDFKVTYVHSNSVEGYSKAVYIGTIEITEGKTTVMFNDIEQGYCPAVNI